MDLLAPHDKPPPTGPPDAAPATLRTWVAARPERSRAHVDFGTRWVDWGSPGAHHRVSWVPTTGEVYVTDAAESWVRVLAVVPTEMELKEALDGWEVVGSGPAPLLWWVENSLMRWADGRRAPSPSSSPAAS